MERTSISLIACLILTINSGCLEEFFVNEEDENIIQTNTSNQDLLFKGKDGSSTITALTLDMSEAGAATFKDKVIADSFETTAGGTFTTASGNDLNIVYPDSRSLFIKEGSMGDMMFKIFLTTYTNQKKILVAEQEIRTIYYGKVEKTFLS